MTRRDPRELGPRAREPRGRVLALWLAGLAACPAQQRAPAQPDLAPAQPDLAPAPDTTPETVIVAVADLAGDRDHLVKRRVLAHLRAFAPGPGAGEGELDIEALDLPRPVLAPDDWDALSPLDALQEGHARARALLHEARAGALIWGTAGPAGAPVLYVTTAESSRRPCDSESAHPSGNTRPATGHVLCALDTGATFLLCATAWARIVPVGCAP
jgi:hypothetical protein